MQDPHNDNCYTAEFKAMVALEAIRRGCIEDLSDQFNLNRCIIIKWKQQALDGLVHIFLGDKANAHQQDKQHARMVRLTEEETAFFFKQM